MAFDDRQVVLSFDLFKSGWGCVERDWALWYIRKQLHGM
jgi:hypothetical protein